MQLKELLRQLKEGEVIGFEKLDDAIGVKIFCSPSVDYALANCGESRTLTTQQITGSGSDLVRDAIEDMLREVRK